MSQDSTTARPPRRAESSAYRIPRIRTQGRIEAGTWLPTESGAGRILGPRTQHGPICVSQIERTLGTIMGATSVLLTLIALFAAIATAYALARRYGTPHAQGRYTTIDGLRGYLAVFVFLHHAVIWHVYLHTGYWSVPPSHVYAHLGESSIQIFFMISAFLFCSKLLRGRETGLDWERLFISRFLRLTPMYFVAVLLLFLIVAIVSGGTLKEPPLTLLWGMAQWLTFAMAGEPDLNGVPSTSLILAGIVWTLRYEWFFYLSLPLLALALRIRPPLPYLLLGLATVAGVVLWKNPASHHLLAFLGGIVAALLVRVEAFGRFARRHAASLVVLGIVGVTVAAFPSGHGNLPVLLLSVAFWLIAGGNTMFGLFVHPVSRFLGEMTYSIYLLHGIALYTFFTLLVGTETGRDFSSTTHSLLVVGLTPILIMASYATFRWIERPAMQRTDVLTDWLRTRLARHPRPVGSQIAN